MYGIYTLSYWSIFPIESPLDAGEWFETDDALEFQSDDLDTVIYYMKNNYANQIYKKPYDKSGNECYLCFIVDSDGYVVSYLDFDKTVHILSKDGDTFDKT